MTLPILAAIVALQSPQPPQAPLTIEEYAQIRQLGEIEASPDGGAVAFTVREPDPGADTYTTVLHIWDPDRGTRTVAPELADARAPRWSPDANWLAFLAPRRVEEPDGAAKPRIWLLTRSEPDAAPLAGLPDGVIDYDWAPDGVIYALVADSVGNRALWRIEVSGADAERVWRGEAGIREIAVSPDGRAVVFSTNGTGADDDYLNYDLRVFDLESRRARRLTSRAGSEIEPVWSPDGGTIVFLAPQNPRYPSSQTELFSVAASGGAPKPLTESFDRTVIDVRWPPGGDILFSAAVGPYTHLFAVRKSGAIERLSRGDHNIGAFDAAAVGSTVYTIRESATEAAELWRIRGPAAERLTDLNSLAREWRLARQEMIRWTAPDGLGVEGLLVYPADYVEGRRYPLLVNPTGGPWSRVRNVLDQPAAYQLFAAQGYAVLAANFRGGSGYGEGFATASRTDLAGGELVDLLAGVDHVIAMGVADSARVAIYGGGNGEYGAHLTSWAISQTPRFQAAVVLAGMPSRRSPASPGGEHARLGARYVEVLSEERSPLQASSAVQTPLLVIEGEAAGLVSYARLLYGALNDRGRPAELVELATGQRQPGPRTSADLFFRQLRWFDKYLKFGGADLFDFYLVGEAVPGPGGWQLRVTGAKPRGPYPALQPTEGRYLELMLEFAPAERAAHDGAVEAFQLDLPEDLSLLAPDGSARPFAGTVTEIFGRETLILGDPGPVSVPTPQPGAAPKLTFHLAFEISDAPAEYRLNVEGFGPVRIWLPRGD